MKTYVRGGVGDFLQCLPYMLQNKNNEYFIHTHYSKAKEFFDEFENFNAKYFFFKDAQEHDAQVDEILSFCDPKITTNFKECPRSFYFKLEFDKKVKEAAFYLAGSFKHVHKIIGIHPFGSDFSKNVYSKFNLPIKYIPPDVIKEVINNNPNYNYIVFGSKSDFSGYDLSESDNIKFACFDNIVSSLACVNMCYKFIGTDSCFKTMSSSYGTKTYCLVGNFDDQTRDFYFIDQYVNDKVMEIFKYSNLETQKQEIINFFSNSIK